jgi:hypothetical protein
MEHGGPYQFSQVQALLRLLTTRPTRPSEDLLAINALVYPDLEMLKLAVLYFDEIKLVDTRPGDLQRKDSQGA